MKISYDIQLGIPQVETKRQRHISERKLQPGSQINPHPELRMAFKVLNGWG